jgi:carboxylate-amine ligase
VLSFRGSPSRTLGVEYELQLLDPGTLDLTDGIIPLLEATRGNPCIKSEYNQCSVEIASRTCKDLAELDTHLRHEVTGLRRTCNELGMALCSAGSHPRYHRLAPVTPELRYREVEQETGYAGYTQIVFATHVHVGMASGEECIRVLRRIRPYLYVLMALSASSPFWREVETGFASFRARELLWAHTYGTAPVVESWDHFATMWEVGRRAAIFESFKDNHWDIRPKPEIGTIEIRAMDAQPTVSETIALVGLVLYLVEMVLTHPEGGPLPEELPLWLEQENRYRASHRGMEAPYITSPDGDVRPLREVASDLLAAITPLAEAGGESRFLEPLHSALYRGPSYVRQLAVYRDTGSLREVTAALVRELDEDLSEA